MVTTVVILPSIDRCTDVAGKFTRSKTVVQVQHSRDKNTAIHMNNWSGVRQRQNLAQTRSHLTNKAPR